MTKDLELQTRRFIEFKRSGLEPLDLEELRENVLNYKKDFFLQNIDTFYVFDWGKEAYYKITNGEGWFFEGVEFDPKGEYLDDEPIIPEYVDSLDKNNLIKLTFGDENLKHIVSTSNRYVIINAEIFADALLEYIRTKK